MSEQLFYIDPEKRIGEETVSLLSLAEDFDRKELRIPDFQREFVWVKEQIIEWIKSIMDKMAIGVIVTYQLKGGGSTYVADGRQRLTATLKFIQSPQSYGFDFDSEQARRYCKAFGVTVQHRIYRDHFEALAAFQRLNQGTALTPLEFYSGFLKLSEGGQIVNDEIPLIVSARESHLIANQRSLQKTGSHKRTRDSFALFLQYISETKQLSFWGIGASTVAASRDRGKAVETALVEYIRKMSIDELKSKIANFDRFISQEVALIDEVNSRVGGRGRAIGYAAMRWTLHLSIWRKNTGRPVALYEAFIEALFKRCVETHGNVVSRVDWIDKNSGLTKYATLNSQSINHLKELCVAFDSNLYMGNGNRKREDMAIGYQASHVIPFRDFGNGETIAEPAGKNMARGARPIDMIGGVVTQIPLAP